MSRELQMKPKGLKEGMKQGKNKIFAKLEKDEKPNIKDG